MNNFVNEFLKRLLNEGFTRIGVDYYNNVYISRDKYIFDKTGSVRPDVTKKVDLLNGNDLTEMVDRMYTSKIEDLITHEIKLFNLTDRSVNLNGKLVPKLDQSPLCSTYYTNKKYNWDGQIVYFREDKFDTSLLPEPQQNTFYIVSKDIVLLSNRKDLCYVNYDCEDSLAEYELVYIV